MMRSNGFLYVTESTTGHVAVIDGTGTIANLAVGTDPGAVIFDPADGMDYVANRASANLSVLSGVSVVGTVGVGTQPAAFAFDPLSGAVYVANNQSGNVTLVVGLSAVGDVTTGTDPSFALFEPSNGYVYVSNRNSSDVSLIDGTERRHFGPDGRRAGGVGVQRRHGPRLHRRHGLERGHGAGRDGLPRQHQRGERPIVGDVELGERRRLRDEFELAQRERHRGSVLCDVQRIRPAPGQPMVGGPRFEDQLHHGAVDPVCESSGDLRLHDRGPARLPTSSPRPRPLP